MEILVENTESNEEEIS